MKCNTNNYTNRNHNRNPNPNQSSGPFVSKLAKGGRSVAGFVGGALPDLELFLRFSHVHAADKLSRPELKNGIWVGYNTK